MLPLFLAFSVSVCQYVCHLSSYLLTYYSNTDSASFLDAKSVAERMGKQDTSIVSKYTHSTLQWKEEFYKEEICHWQTASDQT